MTRSLRLVPLCLFSLVVLACSGANTGADGPDKTAGESSGPACGDEMREGDEVCDGADLGDQSCATIPGFTGGMLRCAADCTAVDTSMCTADPAGAIVRINEITSSAITEGDYAGAGDAIELVNVGGAAAELSGFKISDDVSFATDKTYEFPAGTTLAPGAFLVIVKQDEVTMMGDYPFGISSTDPEAIQLADPNGMIVDMVEFLGADATVSWCRVPDGDGDWQYCGRTFGATNEAGTGETTETDTVADTSSEGGSEETGPVSDSVVVLNEIGSSGDDEIEIYNSGADEADLSGWILTDDLTSANATYDPEADLEKLVFADGTTLAAGAFLVVPKGVAPGHPFGLGADGDAITLLDASATVLDFVAYGAEEATVSYCRIPDGPDGAWQAGCTATFGASNE